MDLSALIFVALAVAWAVYLVPKALKHHEDDADSRSVDGFSDRMRVLARREPVSATEAVFVPARSSEPALTLPAPADVPADDGADETPAASTPAPRPARRPRPSAATRAAAARAASRRRRVLSVLLLGLVVVAGLAVGQVIAAGWVAVPAALVVAWLVACRLLVKRERTARAATRVRKRRRTLADEAVAAESRAVDGAVDQAEDKAVEVSDDTDEIPVVTAPLLDDRAPVDPDAWTPVQVPLPTYVAKAPAGRTVRTIDLDSTGVWSSGRNEADSQLAREADAQRAVADPGDSGLEPRRAAGS